MNVLHLHLSDEPACRFESKEFPELTKDLRSGTFYTQEDLTSLIAYAKTRGVRVIPELDMPGHAGGFRALESHGLSYCDDKKTTLAYTNDTLRVVQTLFTELSHIFEDEIIHFGADEVCKHDVCPSGCNYDDVHAFERDVQSIIRTTLGRTPMGWNDVFSDPKSSEPNAATESCVIQNWGKESPTVFADQSFHVIDSTYREMYLNQQCCRVEPSTEPGDTYSLCYYRDSGQGMTGALRQFMEGGEVAMWNDNYCPSGHEPYGHCEINGTFGWMASPAFDDMFSESVGNMIFPGTAAAAGSLWSYNESMIPKGMPGDVFVNSIEEHVRRLRERNVYTCANGCACDWQSRCIGNASSFYAGHETPYNVKITLHNVGCDFDVKVKARAPCSKNNGDDLAILRKSSSFVAHGTDFILIGSSQGQIYASDQFSIWVGDSTWLNLEMSLNVTCDSSTYITMEPS